MNRLQVEEVKQKAMEKSKSCRDCLVYALIKNGSSMAKITTEKEIKKIFIEVYNFSLWGTYLNGKKVINKD